MKILRVLSALALMAVFSVGAAHAGDKAAKKEKAPAAAAAGKEVTLKGDMMCGKCALKETDKCANVLKVGETKYYLADNSVAEQAHGKVCGGTAKATVTGTVAEAAGKKTLTASNVKYE